jgi:hypothetical protein
MTQALSPLLIRDLRVESITSQRKESMSACHQQSKQVKTVELPQKLKDAIVVTT